MFGHMWGDRFIRSCDEGWEMRCLNLPTRKKRLLAPESDHESISCVRRGLGDPYGVDADTGDARVWRLNNKNIGRCLILVPYLKVLPYASLVSGMYRTQVNRYRSGTGCRSVIIHQSFVALRRPSKSETEDDPRVPKRIVGESRQDRQRME